MSLQFIWLASFTCSVYRKQYAMTAQRIVLRSIARECEKRLILAMFPTTSFRYIPHVVFMIFDKAIFKLRCAEKQLCSQEI